MDWSCRRIYNNTMEEIKWKGKEEPFFICILKKKKAEGEELGERGLT